MATPPVDLATFKEYLTIDSGDTASDVQLSAALATGTETVEAAVGPMVLRSFTDVLDADQCGVVALDTTPAKDMTYVLSSVTPFGGDTLDLSTVLLNVKLGTVSRLIACTTYTLIYNAGRSTVPGPLCEATMITARQLWMLHKRGPEGQARFTQVGPNAGDPNAAPAYRGFAFPNAAAELCEPYRQMWVG